jgi:hypothetical protein
MRKLKQIIELYPSDVLALDENGELWFGTMETTDDQRRVVDWSPVNTPKDGSGWSEPQQSFFDKWEKEARERIANDIDLGGEAVSLAEEESHDASGTGETVQDTPDNDLEDGEGTDPSQ